MRSCLVLGAGMVGVSTALHLQARGWSVVLADRQEPGRATSYGNAGIVQREAVEPYAMPRDWATLAAIATGRSNDVRWRPGALLRQAGPLFRYWWNSHPTRHRRLAEAYASIIGQATAEHRPLMIASGADNLVRRDGFRILYRSRASLDAAAREAEDLKGRFGVSARIMSAPDLMAAEPALKSGGVGAVHWTDPWTVSDPGGLVGAYAGLFVRQGGSVARADAASLRRAGPGWSVAGPDGPIEAETVVVALGPWSPELLRPFGLRVPMVKKRGYHRHWRAPRSLDLPLVDADNGYVAAPMERGLRITSGAELTAHDAAGTPVQLGRAEAAARALLDLGTPVESEPWFGTRPCMPDMLPVVGPVPGQPGLWLHFGHGHQGFTLGPATARLLAELMTGETPYLPAAPFAPSRLL